MDFKFINLKIIISLIIINLNYYPQLIIKDLMVIFNLYNFLHFFKLFK
jgi:hypothetical protein